MGTTLIALTGFEYINNLGRMTRIWEGGWRGSDVGVGLLRNEPGKVGGRKEGTERDRDSKRPTLSTNLDP